MSRKRRKKNLPKIEAIKIEAVAAEGKCIARFEGQVIFIKGVAPGDIVDLQVTRKKKSYLEARVTHFHEYSKDRAEPFCKHFGVCGGCKWQHLPYEHQLTYKQEQISQQLGRIAKVDLPTEKPILAASPIQYYRNKMEYSFSNRRWLLDSEVESEEKLNRNALGFHVPGRFDRIVDIEHCYLQPEPSNTIRLALRDFSLEHNLEFYDAVVNVGFMRSLIIRTANTGETMVIVQFGRNDEENVALVMEFLKTKFPETTSLQYIINTKKNDSYQDLEVILYAGELHINEEMEGLKFRVGAKSFYQTNSKQAYELYKITRDFAQLTGDEIVYDFYTGTGTIANFVAKEAKQVIGIEYVEMAIEDARVSSKLNGIDNTLFYAGDIKDILKDDFLAKHPRPDVIITDPPRIGMHKDVVQTLVESGAKRIVYVSCNPATQARDIALLAEKYKITALQGVDMFPHTHHVESVVCLELI